MLNYLSLITPEHISINAQVCTIELPLEVQVELSTYLVAELEKGVLAFDDLSPVEYKNGTFRLFSLDLTQYFNHPDLIAMLQEIVEEDTEEVYISPEDAGLIRVTSSGNKVFADAEIEYDYISLYKEAMKKGDAAQAKTLRATILECNMGLVKSQIKKYVISGFAETADDLFQEGCLGVLKALDKFDIDLDNKFSTFATNYVKAGIKRYIYDNGRTIRVPEYISQNTQKYKRYLEEARKLGYEPTDEEVIKHLGIPQSWYIELKYALEQEELMNLNAPVSDSEEKGTLADVVEDKSGSDFYRLSGLYRDDFMSVLLEATQKGLEKKKLQALCLYMGLCEDGETHTQEDIANQFGVTKQAIGVWIKQALEYLRNPVYSDRLREIMQEESFGGKHK